MRKIAYSADVSRELARRAQAAGLHRACRRSRYESGDVLDLRFTTVWPEVAGRGRFRVLELAGGGFAGQVYSCVLEDLEPGLPESAGLKAGGAYAVKILVPASACARRFRNLLYWLGFQGPFSPQVNEAACRSGLLWQKLAREAARLEMGDRGAVADVYASFHDPELRAFGEIREWVEGRTWLLEADIHVGSRRKWRTLDLARTASPEYVAKRRFMYRLVRLLHDLGARELAREYEWWTMKSQPNVLKRAGSSAPDQGLCAVDFRLGLALLPCLPLSPADVPLIFRGLARGALAQFDRADFRQLAAYVEGRQAASPELRPMAGALERYDRQYRRSLPDYARHGWRIPFDRDLRDSIRRGLVEGYRAQDLVSEEFAARLAGAPFLFSVFHLLGALPIAGRFARRLWGNAAYRRHLAELLTRPEYVRRTARAAAAACLVRWLRAGRVGDARALYLADHPAWFWLQRLTLGLQPFASAHRAIAEPRDAWARLRGRLGRLRSLLRDAGFRGRWLAEQIQAGREEGLLGEAESAELLAGVRDPSSLGSTVRMAAARPVLARLMAARWATGVARRVPGFGEPGALLEHLAFDASFNVSHRLGRWAAPRLRGLLTVWLLIGALIAFAAFVWMGVDLRHRKGLEILLVVTGVFLLPRLLVYPLLAKKPPRAAAETPPSG